MRCISGSRSKPRALPNFISWSTSTSLVGPKGAGLLELCACTVPARTRMPIAKATNGSWKPGNQERIRKAGRQEGAGRSCLISCFVDSFFSIEVIQILRADNRTLWRTHDPFLAAGIIRGLADGIIRHDIEHEILRTVVGDLVRLTRLKNESVARLNRRRPILVPDAAPAGDYMVEFPLRAVGMIDVGSFPRRDAQDLDVKRMPLHEVRRGWFSPQRLGDLFTRSNELSLGGRPGELSHLLRVYFVHMNFLSLGVSVNVSRHRGVYRYGLGRMLYARGG